MNNMKLAHLILTHANPAQLQRLINRLQHADAHFYIHLDSKSDIIPFLHIADEHNVFFIKNRVKVNWGGYSIVQATLNSMAEIQDSGHKYHHINLLSGQDYPIKSTEQIHRFLKENKDTIFMHSLSVINEWKEAIPRITQYHLSDYHFKGRVRLEQLMNFLLPVRKMPLNLIPVGRSQWFTATPDSIAYILQFLSDNKNVERFFRNTWAPDEMIFQTILYNSPFRSQLVNDNLLYVDWTEGGASPKVLTMADAGQLEHSDKLFARKFSEALDSTILDHLDKIYN
jgi:hypothetical protein